MSSSSRSKKSSSGGEAAAPAVMPNLSTEDQVDQLSQALLREYLHRTGSKGTLALFDGENPRTEKTISSRAVMTGLMHMDAVQGLNKARPKPFSSFMELLCMYRLRKRRLQNEKAAKKLAHTTEFDSSDDDERPEALIPALTASLEASQRRIAELKERIRAAEEIIARGGDGAEAAVASATAESEAPKKKKKDKDKAASKDKADKENALDDPTAEKKAKKKDKKKDSEKKASAAAASGSGAFDPLGLGASKDSVLGIGSKSRTGSGTAVGQSWNPLGAAANIPAVGLGGGSSKAAAAAVPSDTEWRPNYVAGAGMELTTNRVRAAVVPLESAISDSPTRGTHPSSRRTSAAAAQPQEVDSPTLSEPTSPGGPKSVYDPSATSHGVLVKALEKPPKPRKRVVIVGDP